MVNPSMAPTRLIDPPLLDPSWRRVDSLDPQRRGDDMDSDEWEEEEVSYLILDFGGKLAPESLQQERGLVQVLALESTTPYARVGPHFFQGQHESLIGSEVLLQHHPETDSTPSHYAPLASTSTSTTSGRILFRPIKLEPRDPNTEKYHADSRVAGGEKGKTVAGVGPKPRGRPKGSKNRPKQDREASQDGQDHNADREEGLPPLPDLEGGEEAVPVSSGERGRARGRGRPRGRPRGSGKGGRGRGRGSAREKGSDSDDVANDEVMDVDGVSDEDFGGAGDDKGEGSSSEVRRTTRSRGAAKETTQEEMHNDDAEGDE